METIDMKKLETAIMYVGRIAEGNNPINNMTAEENDILNNPNVIRCMFFIKEVLEEVKNNGGCIGKRASKKGKQDFPLEILSSFMYREDKSISKFVDQINELVDIDTYKKMNYRIITQWLKANDFLQEEYSQEFGKNVTRPTEKGKKIGIYAERRSNSRGITYLLILYDKNAQEYIAENMEKILSGEVADEV